MTNSESRTASTSHTPGPWEANPSSPMWHPGVDGDGGSFSIVIVGDKEDQNDDGGIRGRTPGEAEANTRLIAAAPDMLAALVLVRSIIVDGALTGFNCHDGDWAERLFASQQVTHDAVVKAAGREAGRTSNLAEAVGDREGDAAGSASA